MAKRRRSPDSQGRAPAKPAGRWTRPDIKHTSVYLPEALMRRCGGSPSMKGAKSMIFSWKASSWP
jgi:hypothetical protein